MYRRFELIEDELQFHEPDIRDSLQILYTASSVERLACEQLTSARSGSARTHIPGIMQLETSHMLVILPCPSQRALGRISPRSL